MTEIKIEKVNEFLDSDTVKKLISLGFSFDEKQLLLDKITGIEKTEPYLQLVDRNFTMLYTKGKVDKSKTLANVNIDYLTQAKKAGFKIAVICEKDKPVICLKDHDDLQSKELVEMLIIAPIVPEKTE